LGKEKKKKKKKQPGCVKTFCCLDEKRQEGGNEILEKNLYKQGRTGMAGRDILKTGEKRNTRERAEKKGA